MSDDQPPQPGHDPYRGQQPNWGSAYPPPQQPGPPPQQPGPPPQQPYPSYGQQGYGQQGYPPPGYGYGYPAYTPPPPKHPQATTAMVLGIVGVAGGLMCYLPLFVAPFGLYYGRKTMNEIDAAPSQYSGRGEAKAGFILGIIGTVLLAIALAVVILLVVLTFTVDDFWDTDDEYYYDSLLPIVRSSLGALLR